MEPLIGLIPPNREIGERAIKVAAMLGLEDRIILKEGVGDISRIHAVELEKQGVDVIITRGINCDIVKSTVKTPVLEIPVTGQDLVTVLHEAKKSTRINHPRIALLAFAAINRDIAGLAELLDIDLLIYSVINNFEYIRGQIRQAMREGADVVVAGHISSGIAREEGLPTVFLDSGPAALREVFSEARNVAYARKLEQARTRRLQTVIDQSPNGVFVVDSLGNIQAINTMARQILNANIDYVNSKATEVLPTPLADRCLEFSTPIVDEMLEVNGTPILLGTEFVKMGSQVVDIIFTMQPAAIIGELESKLRKSLHTRGLTSNYSFADIWGDSKALKNTITWARSFAATDSPILLMGETGTGKELFAQAIHQVSPYGPGPFVAINCASLPPSLLESELFGHEEGAFTGARRSGKQGLFEIANNGTIFLDEISEMDHYGQTRLLRVLQERCTMRVGGDRYIPVNARVLAASNRNLRELVEKGEFRKDLFYRLNILPLQIPPLRERYGDVSLLAGRFADIYKKKYASSLKLTETIMTILEGHPWPGNVRELAGVIERLALMARNAEVTDSFVRSQLSMEDRVPEAPYVPQNEKADELSERNRILQALKRHNGHQGLAADHLGIHRTTLKRKMKALQINRFG
ncbi:sigma-54-dependent Fis family transcriptional regulator [Pelobacter seleniigenes]|uniref:sigma-54-dependent Fis family transcriptional regulator n=1 Tax=Pelobacter seleniigenes TaxID=407188 RepID=UPI0004A6CB03|nr:sigma-54-dependent Fis family transcriptional regulator [Pelobacter seleniigenes]